MNSDVKHLKNVTKYIARGITPSYDEKGVCVINQRCVRDKSVRLNDARITNPDKKKINEEKFLKKFDVLVNSTGVGTLGRVAQIKNDLKKPLTADSHVTIVRPDLKIIDGLYFGYAMMNAEPHITFLGEGSTGQIELSRKRLASEIEINVPEIFVQKRIAAILSSIDEKIKLNQEMNQTLEQIGQAIFRHWFVHFEFPDSDGRPYKSSGGRMVDSEFGEIPNGWEIGKIYDICDVINGAPFSSKLFNESGDGIPLVRIRDLKKHKTGFFTKEKHPKGTLINPGDIVAGMDAEFRPYFWLGITSWMNQRICMFKPKQDYVHKFFVYETVKVPLKFYENSKVGTTVIHLSKSDIDKFEVVIPPKNVLKEFYNFIDPLFQKMILNAQETNNLITIRDSLLPKLMSGKIRVSIPEEATVK